VDVGKEHGVLGTIFDIGALGFLVGLAVLGLVLAGVIGAVRGENGRQIAARFEGALLAVLGGLLARAFIVVLLQTAHDKPNAQLAIGWAFLLWPGVVDTVARLFGQGAILTTPDALLWIATAVGGLTGMMNGLWRIHDWKGLGWLSFPLDVTWGLGATTNGCLLHLVNIGWGQPQDEPRQGCHRYASGFRFKGTFAFTQGATMSNLRNSPGTDLYRHERLHVWQNRSFGPLFLLSYLGWMVLWIIPALIAGVVLGRPGKGPEEWCYFNCPWETWAYAIQGQERNKFKVEVRLIWRGLFVILWSIPFFGLLLTGFGVLVANLW
jgi:hypothetical protein